jgi:hypothetical protein
MYVDSFVLGMIMASPSVQQASLQKFSVVPYGAEPDW